MPVQKKKTRKQIVLRVCGYYNPSRKSHVIYCMYRSCPKNTDDLCPALGRFQSAQTWDMGAKVDVKSMETFDYITVYSYICIYIYTSSKKERLCIWPFLVITSAVVLALFRFRTHLGRAGWASRRPVARMDQCMVAATLLSCLHHVQNSVRGTATRNQVNHDAGTLVD